MANELTGLKVHQGRRGTVADPTAWRSLCGRSSGQVWRVDTLEQGQNVAELTGSAVTCSFCLRIMQQRKDVTW